MKTILVLTDFSINADYTAIYALRFAQKIKADLLLCNVYKATADELRPDRDEWPLGANEKNSIEDLGALMARLKTLLDAEDETNFRPGINQCSEEGLLKNVIKDIASAHNVLIAIISVHSRKAFSSVFATDHAWKIIEQADFPVLLIPYQVRFKNYDEIAFATDMTVTDRYILKSVAGLAKYTNANVVVTHATDNGATIAKNETELKAFFTQGSQKEENPAILYQVLQGNSVITALKELAQRVSIDMLVLIKRPDNMFKKMFESQVIRELVKEPAKPLLIFPDTDVMKALPVF
jgi:nucleotide-binding universal stress UspA family protein